MIERKQSTHQKTTGYLKEVSHRFADTIPIKNVIRSPG